jgi:hypothetical protein
MWFKWRPCLMIAMIDLFELLRFDSLPMLPTLKNVQRISVSIDHDEHASTYFQCHLYENFYIYLTRLRRTTFDQPLLFRSKTRIDQGIANRRAAITSVEGRNQFQKEFSWFTELDRLAQAFRFHNGYRRRSWKSPISRSSRFRHADRLKSKRTLTACTPTTPLADTHLGAMLAWRC